MVKSKRDSDIDTPKKSFFRMMTFVGNTITIVGCFGLLLGLGGQINLDDISIGITSGIRVIGTVAISGCLLSAIGYGFLEYIDFT